jgi:pyridoxamine 5'-phosphate oxidase
MNTPSLADMRKNYQHAELLESNAAQHPLQQFTTWLNQAISAEIPEPNAMTLATVSSTLRPSTRIVLIKGYDEHGIVWFTNYDSRKGRELAGNPFAALQFHWVELERVVRIEGRVEKISEADSDTYYHSRPLASRIGAWASPQSQTIASREWLQQELKNYADKFQQQPPRPPHWGGYRLVPDSWEFWQGGGARLHDRLHYSLNNGQWQMQRLAP